jgi:hypothetical protein
MPIDKTFGNRTARRGAGRVLVVNRRVSEASSVATDADGACRSRPSPATADGRPEDERTADKLGFVRISLPFLKKISAK